MMAGTSRLLLPSLRFCIIFPRLDLFDVVSLYAGADAAQDAVGNGTGGAGDLLRIDRDIAFAAEQRDDIAGLKLRRTGDIDGGEVHRNCANDGRELSAG